jgi:hypothetical protein
MDDGNGVPARHELFHGRQIGVGKCLIEGRIGGKDAVCVHFAPRYFLALTARVRRHRICRDPHHVLAFGGENCHECPATADGEVTDPNP